VPFGTSITWKVIGAKRARVSPNLFYKKYEWGAKGRLGGKKSQQYFCTNCNQFLWPISHFPITPCECKDEALMFFLYFIEITWGGRICENGGKNEVRAGRAVWWPGIW